MFGIEEIHQDLRAVALDVEQNFLQYNVGAIVHDEGVESDLVVKILVFRLFVFIEV